MNVTQEDRDRREYEAWVLGELARIETWEGSGFDVWDRGKLARAGLTGTRDETDAYRGPWRSVHPYATQEFIWWVEAYGQPRYTFSEWQARARDTRRREAGAIREWLESADYCLSELEVLRDMLARRDELISTARERGAPWAAICEASGLSRMQAHTVAKAYRGEGPQPQPTAADFEAVRSDLPHPFADKPEMRWINGELVEVF